MSKPNPKLTQHRKDRGFTLIELMITVLILGILTSVALPSFREFITNQRIKSTSFDIMAMITRTRSEAIKRNALVTATPVNNDWAQGWTVTDAGGAVLSQQSAQPGLAITCMQGSPLAVTACSFLRFNSNGRSVNAQSIQISSTAITNPKMSCISIDLSGLPKSKKAGC